MKVLTRDTLQHLLSQPPSVCEVTSHCGLISTSQMTTNAEHLCMCLLAMCMSPLEKCPFKSLAHFPHGLPILLSYMSSLQTLEARPLQDAWSEALPFCWSHSSPRYPHAQFLFIEVLPSCPLPFRPPLTPLAKSGLPTMCLWLTTSFHFLNTHLILKRPHLLACLLAAPAFSVNVSSVIWIAQLP